MAYFNYMMGIAEILGADEDVAAEDLKKSLEFEIKLANVSLITLFINLAFTPDFLIYEVNIKNLH